MSTPDSPSDSTGSKRPPAKTKRHTAPGMTRTTLYVSETAATALDKAVNQVVATLGDKEMPRHAALSALLLAGAAQADTVAEQLAKQRAAELAKRLAALQHSQGSTT